MSDGRWIVRSANDNAYGKLSRAYDAMSQVWSAGLVVELIVRPHRARRTLQQNRTMWGMLNDISRCLLWVVNNELQRMSPDEWKDVLTAYLRREARIARGIDGGLVIMGLSTRRLTSRDMSDLITLMQAFGDERGVVWTDPDTIDAEPAADDEWRAAA